MKASILSNHRLVPPAGMAGGEDGACGRSYILRQNGQKDILNHIDSADMQVGDCFVIETPGGGGYGPCATEQEDLAAE